MAKVFISYRRADSAAISGRIYDRLVAKFRRKHVFKDVDDIPAGVNFGAYIQESLRECAVALVVIGRTWLDTRAPDGSRRLDDSSDWVRVEIETALALHLTIMPLLVEGATMPAPGSLPESLRDIAAINALPVRNDPDFAHDMERVITAVEHAFASRPATGFTGLPGLFRRSTHAEPAHERPAVEQPEQAEPVMPPPTLPAADATPTVATSARIEDTSMADMVAAVAADAKPVDPVKQPPVTGKARAQRALLAILAAVLIVASFGVLLSKIPSLSMGAGTASTRTAETSATGTAFERGVAALQTTIVGTETANTQLAAAAVATLPLKVPSPGQDCVQEGMKGFWQSRPGSQYTCDASYTHVTATAKSPGELIFEFQDNLAKDVRVPVDSSYIVSIQMSNLSANGTVDFDVQGSPEVATPTSQQSVTNYYYEIQVQPSGTWVATVERCPPSNVCTKYQPGGWININGRHTLAFSFQNNTATVLVDGVNQGRYSDMVAPGQTAVTLGLYCDSGTSRVDFSNLSISVP